MTVGLEIRQSVDDWDVIEVNSSTTPQAFTALKSQISKLSSKCRESAPIQRIFSGMDLLEKLGLQFILHEFFVSMKWTPAIGDEFTLSAFIHSHRIRRTHRQLVNSLLNRLQNYGLLSAATQSSPPNPAWKVSKLPPSMPIIISQIKHLQTALLDFPECTTEIEFLNHTSWNLHNVLSGKTSGLDVLFPQETSADFQFGAQNLYVNSGMMESTKTIYIVKGVLETIRGLVKREQTGIRILEIGAGTGSTTVPVLNALTSELSGNDVVELSYTFTDISNFFLGKSKARIEPTFPRVKFEFKYLDIEQLVEGQGFGKLYDIIIAADVFHATQYLDDTLTHTRGLLKPGGVLAIGEIFNSSIFLDLTFGLVEGWWRFADAFRSGGSPLISHSKWEDLVKEHGFVDSCSVTSGSYGALFAQAELSK